MGTQRRSPEPRASRRSKPLLLRFAIGFLIRVSAAYGQLPIICDHEVINNQCVDVVAKPVVQTSAETTRRNDEKDRRHLQTIRASTAILKVATDNASSHSPFVLTVESSERPSPADKVSDDDTSAKAAGAKPSTSQQPSSPPAETLHGSGAAVSAIVPLPLKQDLIRVIAVPDGVPPDSLLCDIGFSFELTCDQFPTRKYTIVAEKLDKNGKCLREVPLHIEGAGVAIDIKIRQLNKAAICEIRPKFSLPTSGTQELTFARESVLQKSLNKSLNSSLAAEQSLPGMRKKLGDLKLQLADAQQATTAIGSSQADTDFIRHNAKVRINLVNRAIAPLAKDVTLAEQIAGNKSALETDIADLDKISQYAKKIAASATISVRFYNGDVTIPATVK